MSIEIKQKIKEVADDFGMPAKNLIEIVGKFYDKPKSSSQNLTEEQLNVIFDYITAQNQIGSIAEVFAAAKPKDEPKPPLRADFTLSSTVMPKGRKMPCANAAPVGTRSPLPSRLSLVIRRKMCPSLSERA